MDDLDKNEKYIKSEIEKSFKKDENVEYIDGKLRDLKRVWREKERYIKSYNSQFKAGNWDRDFKFCDEVADKTNKS